MTIAEPAVTEVTPALKLEPAQTIHLPTAVLGLAATADGRTLFAACLDGGVYRVEVESGKSEQLLKHQSYASGVKLLAGERQLVSAGYDGALQWFDLTESKLIRRVAAHGFWSWKLAVSPDRALVASVTGQYLAGSIKYEPADAPEPTVKVFDAATGALKHGFSMKPPVLSVAFSPDSQFVAAGNLMGDVSVWNVATGEVAASWNTKAFTSWGHIKSHHYVGGIYSVVFSPEGNELFLAGMGDMQDPMAGNGQHLWQRFAWQETPPEKVDQIHSGEHGNGLMETLAFHPSGKVFVMAGRLTQGTWNVGLFGEIAGNLVHAVDNKLRTTEAVFSADGKLLFLAGATGQGRRDKEGKCPDFGRIQVLNVVG